MIRPNSQAVGFMFQDGYIAWEPKFKYGWYTSRKLEEGRKLPGNWIYVNLLVWEDK